MRAPSAAIPGGGHVMDYNRRKSAVILEIYDRLFRDAECLRDPFLVACDGLWSRRGSRASPRCHPTPADAKSRNAVAAPGSVGLVLADRCHLDLVQHPRSRPHRRTHPRDLRRPRSGRPAGQQSATCGAHPRHPPCHDPGRTRSAKASPGGHCGPTGEAVSRFGDFDAEDPARRPEFQH